MFDSNASQPIEQSQGINDFGAMPASQPMIDWTTLPLNTSATISTLVPVPLELLNPMHPFMPAEHRFFLLGMTFQNIFYQDAYAMGCGSNPTALQEGDKPAQFYLTTHRDEASFKGVVFEAALVRWMIENPEIGRRIYQWATGMVRNVQLRTYQKFTPIACGQRSLLQDPRTCQFYSTTGCSDIQFLKTEPNKPFAEPAVIAGTSTPAHIQVKAITSNEGAEILWPILNGMYQRVITLLLHPDGAHSYDICMRLLNNWKIQGSITQEQYAYAVPRILHPSAFGIDQRLVNEYSAYISMAYQRLAPANEIQEIGEAVSKDLGALAAGTSLLVSQNGSAIRDIDLDDPLQGFQIVSG